MTYPYFNNKSKSCQASDVLYSQSSAFRIRFGLHEETGLVTFGVQIFFVGVFASFLSNPLPYVDSP